MTVADQTIRELDTVRVVRDDIDTKPRGDTKGRRPVPVGTMGTVVCSYENGRAFAVEIPALHGEGTDVVTLWAGEVESFPPPVDPKDIEVERLRAIVDERWKDVAAADIRLLRAGPAPDGGFGMEFKSPLFMLIAEHLALQFKAAGGENYVTFEIDHDELGPMALTMQRRWCMTPAQVADGLRKEIDAINAAHEVEHRRLVDGLARLANSGGGHTSVMAACLLLW